MANLRTLGVVATMVLGAAGLSSCIWDCRSMGCDGNHSGHRTEQRTTINVQDNPKFEKPKEKIEVLPPLTQVDCGDTLVFNSKADSTEYNKYNQIAWDNFTKVSRDSKAVMDSVVNATKNKLEPKIENLRMVYTAEDEKIKAKYDKAIEQAEKDYENNKITFKQLEAAKEKIEKQYYKDWDKYIYPYVEKEMRIAHQIQEVEDTEFTKHEKADSEAFAKLNADRDEMRAKYTKSVLKLNHTGPLEQDLFGNYRVQYKSKEDSIKANEYIARQSKIYAPIEKKELELEKKFDQLSVQIDKLQDQGKYEQADKLLRQQEKLSQHIAKVSDKAYENRINADSINQYTKKSTLNSNSRYFLNTEE